MNLGVVGAKGIGAVQGGIETYCAQFYRHLSPDEFHVTLFVARASLRPSKVGVQEIVRIRAPRLGALEMPLTAILGTISARLRGVTTLHVHGIGAAICLPLARLIGLRTVVRYLGREYRNGKWGRLGRAVLRQCEQFVARFADRVICLAPYLADEFAEATGRRHGVVVIPNGAAAPLAGGAPDPAVAKLISDGPYLLAVGRLTPQKNFHLLIEAFLSSDLPPEARLLIVGAEDVPRYAKRLSTMAAGNDRVRLVGPIFGADLWTLYRGCRIFVQPSRHEGMSFSLLEAAVAGANIVAADIPANASVCQGFGNLVPVDSVEALAAAMREHWCERRPASAVNAQLAICSRTHGWPRIAEAMAPILREPSPQSSRLPASWGATEIGASEADGR